MLPLSEIRNKVNYYVGTIKSRTKITDYWLNINQSAAISDEDISQNFEFYLQSDTIKNSTIKVEVLASENVDIKVSNFYVKVLK